MRKIGIFLLLAITGLLNAAEQNLIFNGDFRLGTAGFGVWRLLRPDTNPELQLPALYQQGVSAADREKNHLPQRI